MTEETSGPLSLQTLCLRSKKRSRDLYSDNLAARLEGSSSYKIFLEAKVNREYGLVKDMPPPQKPQPSAKQVSETSRTADVSSINIAKSSTEKEKIVFAGTNQFPSRPGVTIDTEQVTVTNADDEDFNPAFQEVVQSMKKNKSDATPSYSLIAIQNNAKTPEHMQPPSRTKALALRNPYASEKPTWHPHWKLMRVISGHLGWVRSIAVDPSNEWFATGAADRTIKIWDLASGTLKLTLTGHINAVRGLAVSARHPYLFSCGEDKMIKCWDLECNKVIRHYHGHLSGVYCLALHPTLDVLVTGGRDSVARVWDMRTKQSIHVLTGHSSTVASVVCQSTDPQIVTGAHDSCIKLWDLAKGSCYSTLTHHKKSIRALAMHPTEYTMASGAPDNIKAWKFPEGKFMRNFSGHQSIVHTLAINNDNVMVSGADNGSMYFWDWKSGYNFQRLQTAVQPGSLESEAGIFAMSFDQTGSRLITCEADKTIKVYKEDESSNEESHPIDLAEWKAQSESKRYG